jgi:hypothetical protein
MVFDRLGILDLHPVTGDIFQGWKMPSLTKLFLRAKMLQVPTALQSWAWSFKDSLLELTISDLAEPFAVALVANSTTFKRVQRLSLWTCDWVVTTLAKFLQAFPAVTRMGYSESKLSNLFFFLGCDGKILPLVERIAMIRPRDDLSAEAVCCALKSWPHLKDVNTDSLSAATLINIKTALTMRGGRLCRFTQQNETVHF